MSPKQMAYRYSKTIKTLFLAGAVIAPATILAFLGLRAYRAETLLLRSRFEQDQAAIVRLVADRISDSARKALEDLEERFRAGDPDAALESRFSAAYGFVRHIFLVEGGQLIYPRITSPEAERPRQSYLLRSGQLVSELDVENYVSRLRESRRLGRLIARALKAEYAGRLGQAGRLFALVRRGQGTMAAQALLGLARTQLRRGRPAEAAKSFRELRERFAGRQDGEGVAYALLADAGLAESSGDELLLPLHQRLLDGRYLTSSASRRFYLRWNLERMTETQAVAPTLLEQLRQQTSRLFAAEQFGARLLRHGIVELQQQASGDLGSMALDRATVLVLHQRGSTLAGYAVDEAALRRAVQRQQGELATGRPATRLQLSRTGDVHALARERVLHTAVLPPPMSEWAITAILPAEDPLDSLEQRGASRQLGLVVGLILILLVGLILTYRAVRHESELAQLKSDFASNVSHELKTPLTAIRMYAEMLDEGIAATPGDQQRYHQVIIRESERLGRLITNVLDFSRVERGTRRYELRSEDLEELTREAVETFRRLSEGEQIETQLESAPRQLLVQADREAATQSILNLLSNAAKYSPGHSQITVALIGGESEAGVAVSDRGIGIPPAEQQRIFDDFYRGTGARKVGVEGTGLGLALVRRHMETCQGRVEVVSTPGEGSTFTLWFRYAMEKDEEHAADSSHRG